MFLVQISLFLLFFVGVFLTGMPYHYCIALFYTIGVLVIWNKLKLKKLFFWLALTIWSINALSQYGGYLAGIAWNYSWFFQMAALPLVLIAFDYIYQNHRTKIEVALSTVLLAYVCLAFIQIGLGFNARPNIIYSLLGDAGFGETYQFSAAASEKIGLGKSVLPWALAALFLYKWSQFKPAISMILACAIVIWMGLIGARSALLGLLSAFLLMGIHHLGKFSAIVIVMFLGNCVLLSIWLNIEVFEQVTNFSGRFFVPVFSSQEILTQPFGFGRGNYGSVAAADLIPVETTYLNFAIFDVLQADPSKLYPIAESDILLVLVELGWVALLLFLGSVLYVVLRSCSRANADDEFRRGAVLLLFLVVSGVSQDFMNVPVSVLLYGLAITLIGNYSRRSQVGSDSSHRTKSYHLAGQV